MTIDEEAGRRQSPFGGNGSFADSVGPSVERLPGFEKVLDLFAAGAETSLEPLLGCKVGATMEPPTVDELFAVLQRFQGAIGATLHCDELDARVLIIIDQEGIEAILGAIFGVESPDDAKQGDAPRAARKALTRIETNLVRETAIALCAALEAALRTAMQASFVLARFAAIDGVDALGRRDMSVVASTMLILTRNGQGRVALIMPQSLLKALRYELAEKTTENLSTDPRWARQIEASVSRADLELSVVLDEIEMTLAEVASIAIGQTIELRNARSGRVQLQADGRSIFWARVEEADGRYLAIVEDPVVDAGFVSQIHIETERL